METIDPIYQLGRVAVKDESTERTSYYIVNEQGSNGGTMTTQRSLRFRIDDLNSYIVLSRSYLQLRCRIRKNADITLGDRFAFKNGLHTIFRRAVLRLNGQSVNDYSDFFYHKQDLECLMMSKATKDTLGSAMQYYDQLESTSWLGGVLNAGNAVVTSTFGHLYKGVELVSDRDPAVANLYSPSFVRRVAEAGPYAVAGGQQLTQEVVATDPLHVFFPFLKAYDRVMRGMSVEMEFELADNTIVCEAITGGVGAFEWSGQGVNLFVHRVVPSLRVRNELNSMITKGFSLNGFSFEDVTIHRSPTIVAGSSDWRISTTVSRPTKIFIARKRIDRSTSHDLASNGFDCQTLKSIQLFVNGQPIPDLRYEPNFDDARANVLDDNQGEDRRDRMRAYMEFLKLIGQDQSPHTSDLLANGMSYDHWVLNYPVFSFDVSRNLPQDTAFTGASEILVRTTHGTQPVGPDGLAELIAWVYHEKLADIKFTSTESSIVIS